MTNDQNKKRSNIKFKLTGLTTQVFIFVVLPISLLLIIISFGSMALHQDAMRALVGERDRRTVRSASNALRDQLNHRLASIHGLAIRVQDDASLDSILDSVDFLIPDFDFGLAFFSTSGELLSGKGDAELWESLNSTILNKLADYLEIGIETPVFSEPFPHPVYDNYLILALAQTGLENTIAIGLFSVSNFSRQTLAGTTTYEDQSSVYLVDGEGQLLYHSGALPESGNPIDYPGVNEALHGESGTSYHMVEGTEHVVAFNSVAPTGWALVIEESWDSVASPILRYTEIGSLVLIPILIFALTALWLSARQIIQPLKELESLAAALADGDYDSVESSVGGIEEIKSLQNTLIKLSQKVKKSQKSLRKYIGSITKGQEEERRRLARDLHDETLQSLIALNQRIQLIRLSEDNKSSKEALIEIQEMINETMQELRRLTRALRPLYLEDLGLVAALDMLARETSKNNGIPIKFSLEGKEARLPDYSEIAIYRIVQEALSNITKHANANNASVSLIYKEKSVLLTIIDDGKGFNVPENPSELSPDGHFGLLGIYERADLINASFSVNSILGKGSQILINIPI